MVEQIKQQIEDEGIQLSRLAQKALKEIYQEVNIDTPKNIKINFIYKKSYDNLDKIDLPTQYSFNILFKNQDGKVCEPSFTITKLNENTLKEEIKRVLKAYHLL